MLVRIVENCRNLLRLELGFDTGFSETSHLLASLNKSITLLDYFEARIYYDDEGEENLLNTNILELNLTDKAKKVTIYTSAGFDMDFSIAASK